MTRLLALAALGVGGLALARQARHERAVDRRVASWAAEVSADLGRWAAQVGADLARAGNGGGPR